MIKEEPLKIFPILSKEQLDYIAEQVTENLQKQVDKQVKDYLCRHYEDDHR